MARLHDALYRKTRRLEGREESPPSVIIAASQPKPGLMHVKWWAMMRERRLVPGLDPGIKGRKRHIVVDTVGLILKCEVDSASIRDRDGAALVFDRLTNRFPFIKKICGDGGYQVPIAQANSPRPLEIIKRNQAA